MKSECPYQSKCKWKVDGCYENAQSYYSPGKDAGCIRFHAEQKAKEVKRK